VLIRIPEKVSDPAMPGMVLYKYFADNPAAAPLDSLDCLTYLMDDISKADPDFEDAVGLINYALQCAVYGVEVKEKKQRRK
jgi:hypothetical protein